VAVALTLPGVEVPPYSCRLDDNVWGLDISTRRVSVGVAQGRGPGVAPEVGWFSHEVEQHQGDPARRLVRLAETLPPFLAHIASAAPPAAVLAEQPYGQGKSRPHPQSYYVVSVVLVALGQAFPDARIDVIDPTSWKCDALGAGKGAAKKPAILGWAQATLGYPGDCRKCHGEGKGRCDEACRAHDEADCLGVTTCAAIRWSRDRRLR
jgi:hypothetical protein